jgi:hypothetical protein
MRVALLASTIALLASSPAFAQCVYVACNNGGGGAPVYQAPMAPAPQPPQNNARADYDAGYVAGLAARSTTHVRRTTTTTRAVSRSRHGAAPVVKRHRTAAKATSPRRHVAVAPRPAVRHVARVAPRPAVRHVTRTPVRHVAHVTQRTTYTDPIKDRARTYGSASFGSVTTMASLMSTTWVGPSTVSTQNGQTCGWGARIITNQHGLAQRQAMWVCQCPQGWRPPGY